MEGKEDIFKELREKFVDTYTVRWHAKKTFLKMKKSQKLVLESFFETFLRDFPFNHEFSIRNSSVTVEIHIFQTFCSFFVFIWHKSHFCNDLKIQKDYRMSKRLHFSLFEVALLKKILASIKDLTFDNRGCINVYLLQNSKVWRAVND